MARRRPSTRRSRCHLHPGQTAAASACEQEPATITRRPRPLVDQAPDGEGEQPSTSSARLKASEASTRESRRSRSKCSSSSENA